MPAGIYERKKIVTIETRAKMRAARIGKVVTQQTRERIGAANRHENYITCPCGKQIRIPNCQLKRKKYCSKTCKYKYYTKRSRLKEYNITKVNPGWFNKEDTPWNKGLVGVMPTPKNHKGDAVGYSALHDWVERVLGKPNKCEHCGVTDKRMEWANKSHEYKRVKDDWIRLCKKCHVKYDRQNNDKNWGLATKRFLL